MDYNKIGEFIANERKAKKITQAKLAEKLFVSEKTISKWENGNGVPDTSVLPKMCEVFSCTLNELLNGERIKKEEYSKKAEEKLLKLQKQKEERDKILLNTEIVLVVMSLCVMLIPCFIGSILFEYYSFPEWKSTVITLSGLIPCLVGLGFALRIEQVAGYYECKECGEKRVPSYKETFVARHIGRTRCLKCPKCKKRTWYKKVIK